MPIVAATEGESDSTGKLRLHQSAQDESVIAMGDYLILFPIIHPIAYAHAGRTKKRLLFSQIADACVICNTIFYTLKNCPVRVIGALAFYKNTMLT